MFLTELDVDAPDRLLLNRLGCLRIRDLSAGIARLRQHLRNLDGGWTEKRGIDLVVRESQRGRQREVALGAALCRGHRREVSIQHGRRRYERDDVGWSLLYASALVRTEEEDAVLQNGAAKHAAELITHETIVEPLAGLFVDGGKRARRVEPVVAREFEQVAVERVGAALGRDARRPAGFVPVLRVLGAGFDLELLHRVREGQREVVTVVDVVMQRAVQQVCDAERRTSADRNAARLRQAAT